MPIRAPKYSHAVPGDHNMRCDRCGAKAKASELVFDSWHGIWVHPDEFDGQHPIERAALKVENEESVPFNQTPTADRFDDTDVDGGDVGIPEATYAANGGGNGAVDTGTFEDQVIAGTVSPHVE